MSSLPPRVAMGRLCITLASAIALWSSIANAQVQPNAVQREMAQLHLLVLTSVAAIENGVLESIPQALEKVHEAREETEKAVDSGEWKPPRPGTTVNDFVKQDAAFHMDLERLAQAAGSKDLSATTRQLGAVLTGCTACHLKFRVFPPAKSSK